MRLSCINNTGALYSKLQNTKRQQAVAGLVTNDDRNSVVFCLQAAAERHQLRRISDERRKAVPCVCQSYWEGSITKRRVTSGQYDQCGCVSRTQAAASVNVVRRQTKAPSEVGQRHDNKDSGEPERTAKI